MHAHAVPTRLGIVIPTACGRADIVPMRNPRKPPVAALLRIATADGLHCRYQFPSAIRSTARRNKLTISFAHKDVVIVAQDFAVAQ